MKPLLIRHLEGEPVGHLPVWLMRQAGRYLPAYRAIREKHSFWEMVETPDLVVKVSLLPLEVLNVDACIFFSDILTPPYGMKIPIEMKEAVGPVVTTPFTSVTDFARFQTFDPKIHTPFVGESLSRIRKQMPAEKTLYGFAGAPWTVGCYLVQGRGKTDFEKIRTWHNSDPKAVAEALEYLGKATASYLHYQLDSGADIVQMFDTWLGNMSIPFFTTHYLAMINRIADSVRKRGAKFVYFAKGAQEFLPYLSGVNCDVMGVENSLDILKVDEQLGGKFSLQGNLDPLLLLEDEGKIRRETRLLVDKFKKLKRPGIVNLGHGVLPKTPVENVRAFVEEARALWV